MITTNNNNNNNKLYEQQQQIQQQQNVKSSSSSSNNNTNNTKKFNTIYYHKYYYPQQSQPSSKLRTKSLANNKTDFISVTQSYLLIDDEFLLKNKIQNHYSNDHYISDCHSSIDLNSNCIKFFENCFENNNRQTVKSNGVVSVSQHQLEQNEEQKQQNYLLKKFSKKFSRKNRKSKSDNTDDKSTSDDLNFDNSSTSTSTVSTMPKFDGNPLSSSNFTTTTPTHNTQTVFNKKLRKLIPFYYGIKNHGNTCFINSIIQCVIHTQPLCYYFLSKNLINQIYLLQQHPQQQQQTFYLLKTFNAFLMALWSNKYEQQLSLDFKNLCGYLNKQFAGQDQNDALEFCLWFLNLLNDELILFNKLSQQYTVKSSLSSHQSSIIEELFTIELKSILKCCKCNYTSVKNETSMCISLPLPQKLNRVIHLNLILTNKQSIKTQQFKNYTTQHHNNKPTFYNQTVSKSVFYIDNSVNASNNNNDDDDDVDRNVCVRIALNVPINGNVGDILEQIGSKFQLDPKRIIFFELNGNGFNRILQHFDLISQLTTDLCLIETNPNTQANTLNIVSLNIFQKFLMHTSTNQTILRNIRYGLPNLININRDCTYAQLCEKLLHSQSKYLKQDANKHLHKYKTIAEQLFRIVLIDPSGVDADNQFYELNASDECPLYAQIVDRIIDAYGSFKLNTKFICMYVKWKPLDNINSFFKDVDPMKPDIIHSSVKQVDELENQNQMAVLNDCFELFTQIEELNNENTWLCPECRVQTNAMKKLSFNSLPPILILHFKRFCQIKNMNSKLSTPIRFPLKNLDLNKYVDNKNREEQRGGSNYAVYDLFAVSNHHGSLSNGHYTAYCKNPVDTRWYCYDDSDVSPIDPSNVCNSSAYILFYKRNSYVIDDNWWKYYVDQRLFYQSDFIKYIETTQQPQATSNYATIGLQSTKTSVQNKRLTKSQSNCDLTELSATVTGNGNGNTGDVYELQHFDREPSVLVNYYDEDRKPTRLLNKSNKQQKQHSSATSSPKSNVVNSGVLTANQFTTQQQQQAMYEDMRDYELIGNGYGSATATVRDYNQILQPEKLNGNVAKQPHPPTQHHRSNGTRPKQFDELTSLFKQKFNITDEQFNPQTSPNKKYDNVPNPRKPRYY